MIFSCNSLDLADALIKISTALPQRKLSAILEGIKIEAIGDVVKLTATDMEFTIVKTIRADVKMSGEVLVPGKIFVDFIKKLNSDSIVEIIDEEDNIILNYLDNKTTFKTLNIKDYPIIKDYDYENKIVIKQEIFKDLINKTCFAANMNDENRPVLKGCLLKVEGNILSSVALDGFRLAICEKELDKTYDDREINIPAKDLDKISKLLEDDKEDVDLCFAEKKLIVEYKDIKIISTPIEGFVNYKASMPRDFETEITVNKQQLETVIDRISVISKFEKANLVKFEIKNTILKIFSASEEATGDEKITVLTKGKDIIVGYNSRYIMDCLKKINDEYITIKMNYSSPSIITAVENSDYTFLILPIRIK